MSIIKSSSDTGIDGITSYLIKNVIDEIKHPLTFLFDLSISSWTFPDILKVAKIVPIFKTDDNTIVSNYRPISILPFFSKILETLTSNRLLVYLNDNDILVPNQFGFREKYST